MARGWVSVDCGEGKGGWWLLGDRTRGHESCIVNYLDEGRCVDSVTRPIVSPTIGIEGPLGYRNHAEAVTGRI